MTAKLLLRTAVQKGDGAGTAQPRCGCHSTRCLKDYMTLRIRAIYQILLLSSPFWSLWTINPVKCHLDSLYQILLSSQFGLWTINPFKCHLDSLYQILLSSQFGLWTINPLKGRLVLNRPAMVGDPTKRSADRSLKVSLPEMLERS